MNPEAASERSLGFIERTRRPAAGGFTRSAANRRPWRTTNHSESPLPARAAAIALALLVGVFGAAEARAERIFLPLDREGAWLAPDKTLHFAASAAIAASFRVEGAREEAAFRYTIGIGVAKEVFDAAFQPARDRRGASRKDLVMDLLGTVAGLALVRALDR